MLSLCLLPALQGCDGFTTANDTYVTATEVLGTLRVTSLAKCCAACTASFECEVYAFCAGSRCVSARRAAQL